MLPLAAGINEGGHYFWYFQMAQLSAGPFLLMDFLSVCGSGIISNPVIGRWVESGYLVVRYLAL